MATVRVLVVDAATGRPLPWVVVWLDSMKDSTDERGVAEFYNVPPGRYRIKVRTMLYAPYTGEVSVSPGENTFQVRLMRAHFG